MAFKVTAKIDLALKTLVDSHPRGGVSRRQAEEHLVALGLWVPRATCQLDHLATAGKIRKEGLRGHQRFFPVKD